MFENYFKIGWRNLIRQKMYSSIKIGGFAIGVAACLLITLFIRQELSYDLHYKNGSRIYRILRQSSFRGEFGIGVHFPAPFAGTLREEYPEFENIGHYNPVEFFGAGSNEVRRTDQLESTHEDSFTYADQGLLEVLEAPFIMGSIKQALTEPNTIVITKKIADKYFRNEDPIGKTFILNNDEKRQYTITGVIADFPLTSHFRYDFLLTMAGQEFYPGEQTNWSNSNYLNYVLIRPGTDVDAIEKKLSAVLKNHFMPFVIKNGGDKEELDWLKNMSFVLQPVHDIYLNELGIRDGLRHGDIRYIWLFGAIAGFILIIACINFINLATAKSAGRAREVGLRKVVGSLRNSLIKQFLTESVLFSVCSFLIGAVLAWALLPYFNLLLAKSLVFPWKEWWFLPVFATGAILVGVVAGIYPAFYLSSFRPVQVLKGKMTLGRANTSVRSSLVVFQFAVSILLIIGTVVIYRQMDYILTKKLGFDKEQVMLLQGTHTLGDKIKTFKEEILRLPDVKSASISGFIPVEGGKRDGGEVRKIGMAEEQSVASQHWRVDQDYIKTFGLKIIQGREFTTDNPTQPREVIINESLAKSLNMSDPIGQTILGRGEYTVVGVVGDFHFESMREKIDGMILFIERSPFTVAVKVNGSDMQKTIDSISKVWKQFSPHQAIRFTFLDQSYARMYDDVQRMGRIFTSFAILAIVVACLGLFALSAFTVEQRSKEISIRLVLGASLKNIFNMLTLNFIKLVVVSIFIAVPVAWYLMQKWLEDFSYKIEMTWDIYAVAGFIALMIALTTISYQSIRAAFINPAERLKSE
ncbi:MAG: hypothetical protein C0490_08470 [Marivirga sp.]|nr:hypothetical protein [Marivirga sp.]